MCLFLESFPPGHSTVKPVFVKWCPDCCPSREISLPTSSLDLSDWSWALTKACLDWFFGLFIWQEEYFATFLNDGAFCALMKSHWYSFLCCQLPRFHDKIFYNCKHYLVVNHQVHRNIYCHYMIHKYAGSSSQQHEQFNHLLFFIFTE